MRALALITLIAIAGLAGCRHDRRPDLPEHQVVKPQLITVERRVYVPVPSRLTQPLPIAEGTIAQCFAVAADRKAQLVAANARLAEIQAIEGTQVEDDE